MAKVFEISPSKIKKIIKITPLAGNEIMEEEIYKIIDSFLVEAKDQNGNERSLERLNQDRHLAADALDMLLQKQKQETLQECVEVLEKMKRGDDPDNYEVCYAIGGYNNALTIAQQKIKELK